MAATPAIGTEAMDRQTGATARLGRFAARCTEQKLSNACLDKAAACMLDAFGLGLISRDERTSLAMRQLASRQDGGRNLARLWGDGAWTTVSDAVEANAVAAHAHFHDDSEYSSWTHPGSLIVPVAVSLGEAEGASVAAVLRAVVSGYAALNWLGAEEEVARALISRGVRTSPTLGTIGAAAAAATLLGLNDRQAANAVGMATSITGGLLEPVRTGSDEWRLQNATAARGGLRAAQLARSGIVGAATALEGPKGLLAAYAAMTEEPARWARDPDPESIITEVVAKPFATLGDNIAAAIAAKLHFDDGIDVARIKSVRVTLWRHYAEYPGTSHRGPFTEVAQALASTVFATAAMLILGEIEYDVSRDRREDATILRLAKRITIEPDDEGGPADSTIEIEFEDGTRRVRSSREAAATLLYHDRATALAVLEDRTVRTGWPAGCGSGLAEAVFAQIDGESTIGIRDLLDRLFKGA